MPQNNKPGVISHSRLLHIALVRHIEGVSYGHQNCCAANTLRRVCQLSQIPDYACIPTKSLVHAARAYKQMKRTDFFGLPVSDKDAD